MKCEIQAWIFHTKERIFCIPDDKGMQSPGIHGHTKGPLHLQKWNRLIAGRVQYINDDCLPPDSTI
jgi:hypothetical protein